MYFNTVLPLLSTTSSTHTLSTFNCNVEPNTHTCDHPLGYQRIGCVVVTPTTDRRPTVPIRDHLHYLYHFQVVVACPTQTSSSLVAAVSLQQ